PSSSDRRRTKDGGRGRKADSRTPGPAARVPPERRRPGPAARVPPEGPSRSLYWRQFLALEGVLEDYDYVYNSRPTDAGLMAAALRVENELFVTEVLR